MKSLLRNFLIGAIVLYIGLLIQREGFDDSSNSSPPSSAPPSPPPSNPSEAEKILAVISYLILVFIGPLMMITVMMMIEQR